MRDIAHNFPMLVKRAIEAATENEMPEDEALQEKFGEYCVKLAKFIKNCVGDTSPETVQDAYADVGLLDAEDEQCTAIFDKWMTRVMFGMYFQSIKEATHPGETPIGVKQLMELVIPDDEQSAESA
jgi:hypothetical protein